MNYKWFLFFCFRYWLIVYSGVKWIGYQTFPQINCDNVPGCLVAIIHTLLSIACLEIGILYIFVGFFATLLAAVGGGVGGNYYRY